MRYPITNYRFLTPDTVYTFKDSEGEEVTYLYRGFYYCEDWNEDALVFWMPGTTLLATHWPASEFQQAYINEEINE